MRLVWKSLSRFISEKRRKTIGNQRIPGNEKTDQTPDIQRLINLSIIDKNECEKGTKKP
tara:strand:- start:29969 stop:30145 length:177 start_codon:yes stop_codon:yes gene_type:complete